MYVRLGFSVAVHVHPEILIIDEVIAVGDEEFQRRCFEHLYKLRNEGVTIVMVTHSLGIVQTCATAPPGWTTASCGPTGPAPDVVFEYVKTVNEAEEARLERARTPMPEPASCPGAWSTTRRECDRSASSGSSS